MLNKPKIRVFTKSLELVTRENESNTIPSSKVDLTAKWIFSDGSKTTENDTQINYFYDLRC
jgi:hypothetical protein